MKILQSAAPTFSLKRKRKGGKSEKKRKDDKIKSVKRRKEARSEKRRKDSGLLKSGSVPEVDHDDDEEFDCESSRNNGMGRMMQDPDDNDSGLLEGSETEDDVEFSHSGQEDIGTNGYSTDQVHMSSFNLHLKHNLSKEEIDNQKNRKFNWAVPATGMSNCKNCKWTGTGNKILEDLNANSFDGLMPKLYEHWMDVHKTSGGKHMNSPNQKTFFSLCNSYRDILYSNKRPFYLKGLDDTSIMDAYIMHSLNHVFRTSDCIKKNAAKLDKLGEGADSDRFQDQGFTRPKVLILLPLASILHRVVKRLIQLTPSAYKVDAKDMNRFSTKFGSDEHENSEDNGKDSENAKSSKPFDRQVLLGGNNEDDFMIGIKFKGKTIKLFSDFHTSDIIVASALCLVHKIAEAWRSKEKDVNFLSSIEVLIIDHADVLAMQNWSHVETVISHLNRLPLKKLETDVRRIRPWYIDEYARFYRQSIILGSYSNQDINGTFNQQCCNYEGKVKLICEYKGVLHKVLPQIGQIYKRFHADSKVDAIDARFDFLLRRFTQK